MLLMHRKVLAQAVMQTMDHLRFDFFAEYNYENAKYSARAFLLEAAVVEVPETADDMAEYCLAKCDEIKTASPECSILLMCPEESESGRNACIEAKRTGRIDDFVFYDTSLKYLISKLDALL
jgi:hypothetical protein